MLLGLGAVWILDGLEVTIVGAVGSTLTTKGSGIAITPQEIGYAAATYILGACIGALLFGHLTDRFGRRKLFLVTLGLYLVATVLTATSHDASMFCAFRFFTGMGIGGEYAAINSAIDELIPARVRGTVDLMVNGSFWLGTAAGAAATIVLLDPSILAIDVGWRVCFVLGTVLAIGILFVRKGLPESPRWLLTHGRVGEAERVVADIERRVVASTGEELEEPPESDSIEIHRRPPVGVLEVARVVFGTYPRRSIVGLSLFVGQAFLYNAVFFTFSLVLTTFYGVSPSSVGYFIIAFAIGNFLGPLVLGRLFDVIGRRAMIGGTYVLSGILLAVTARLFDAGVLTATTQTVAWGVIFFFASAGASAAYLTVSEVFPMETRALSIAIFYAVGTAIGGIAGPSLFGNLVATKRPSDMALGYLLAAVLMVIGGVVEIFLGVDAEQKSLEDVASPLSADDDADVETNTDGDAGAHTETGRPLGDSQTAGRTSTHVRAPLRHRRGADLPRWHRVAPSATSSWSPLPRTMTLDRDHASRAQVAALVAVLRRDGPLPVSSLTLRVPHARWGPGQFWAALREAIASGQVHGVGRGLFAATAANPHTRSDDTTS